MVPTLYELGQKREARHKYFIKFTHISIMSVWILWYYTPMICTYIMHKYQIEIDTLGSSMTGKSLQTIAWFTNINFNQIYADVNLALKILMYPFR